MPSDQNTPNCPKILLIITLSSLVVTVAFVALYLSARQASFAKTQPYSLHVQLSAATTGTLSAEYDYGYGFNAGHQQKFAIEGGRSMNLDFSVSAWKTLNSIRFSSDENMTISDVRIKKKGVEYLPLKTQTRVAKELPLVINEVARHLLELR